MKYQIDDFEVSKNTLNNLEEIHDIIENPVCKYAISLLEKLPIIGTMLEPTMEQSFRMFQNKKRQEICNIIFSDNRITKEMVNDVSFIVEFSKLIEVVDRLSSNSKLEFLGKLFKNSVLFGMADNYDYFEEFLYRFKEMSEREIEILQLLYEEEFEFLGKGEVLTEERQKELAKVWREFRIKALNYFSIDEATLRSILIGIQRTGFCSVRELHFAGGDHLVFTITKYYMDFVELMKK